MNKCFLDKANQKLNTLDPILGQLTKTQNLKPLQPHSNYFASLCRSINAQQISVAAASAIFSRLTEVTNLVPTAMAKLSQEDIKLIGLSRQKVTYLQDLARHFVDNPKIFNHLEKLDDASVITDLTQVKGIGVWTAQMFLINSLARPDVFAPDDVGLQRAINNLYGFDQTPGRAELVKMSDKWQPYRTVASLHLWFSLSGNPSIYKA